MQAISRLPVLRGPILLFTAWALGAAAPVEPVEQSSAADDELVASLRHLQSLDQRLADVAWRLATANHALCEDKHGGLGIAVHNAAQYVPSVRAAAIAAFGFGDGYPSVLSLADASPARLAGVQVGDRIAAIDAVALPPHPAGAGERSQYDGVDEVMSRLEAVPAGATVELVMLRGKERLTVPVTAQSRCRVRVELVPGGKINAASDEKVVRVQGKLLSWVRSDDELALVVAHEMAHVFLRHHRQLDRQGLSTGAFSGFGANGRKLRDLEREADRTGIFMAARAGYDFRIAGAFWRRRSKAKGFASLWAGSHPSAVNRGRNADAAVAEVEAALMLDREPVP